MSALAALLAQKRKDVDQIYGSQKSIKTSTADTANLQRKRAEEEAERARKAISAPQGQSYSAQSSSAQTLKQQESLPAEEVIRRLRRLGEPATLFGETEVERVSRLQKAQENMKLEDEHIGAGQQSNELLEIQRQKKRGKGSGQSGKAPQQEQAADGQEGQHQEEELDPTAAAFKEAAQALKQKQDEEKMTMDERIAKYFKQWCDEWRQDLDRRPAEVKASGSGAQATNMFEQTVNFFKPLYRQLRAGVVVPEMKAGLWMIIQAIMERNYLSAYDIYMHLAIGNNPWPIGVTSVGIHERSAREKISHVMNAAHIMNDEATRKFLQAIKRLLTFMQRAYPTDPSRCVDFDAHRDAGRGGAGSGSDKLALLEAAKRGEDRKTLGLLPAPHYVEADGSIKVPEKWENIVRRSEAFKGQKTPPRTPPQTPPRSPLK